MKRLPCLSQAVIGVAALATLSAAEPTYEQTVEWLKGQYESTERVDWVHFPGEGVYGVIKLNSIKNGRVSLTYTHFIGSKARPPTTYDVFLSSMERSVVTKNPERNDSESKTYHYEAYEVNLVPRGKTEPQDYKRVYASNDRESAERVAKAYNHLIKLGAPDDLFGDKQPEPAAKTRPTSNPPAEPTSTNSRSPATVQGPALAGVWKISFTFERNPGDPSARRMEWFRFLGQINEKDGLVKGTMAAESDPNVTLTFRGRFKNGRFEGTMRMAWDSNDWEKLVFTLSPDGRTGQGEAVAKISESQKHEFSIRLVRQ